MDYSADNWVHWDVSWKEMWEEFRRRFPTHEDIERAKNIVLDRYRRKELGRLLNKREYAEYLIEWPYDTDLGIRSKIVMIELNMNFLESAGEG
jgi:hypothetical protein